MASGVDVECPRTACFQPVFGPQSKFYKVSTGFGKSWKVMELNGKIWKGEDFQNGYGKVLAFLLEKS